MGEDFKILRRKPSGGNVAFSFWPPAFPMYFTPFCLIFLFSNSILHVSPGSDTIYPCQRISRIPARPCCEKCVQPLIQLVSLSCHLASKWLSGQASWPPDILSSWPPSLLASWPPGLLASWPPGLLASWHPGLLASGLLASWPLASWTVLLGGLRPPKSLSASSRRVRVCALYVTLLPCASDVSVRQAQTPKGQA
jgi:hypothetical protein